MLLLALLTKRRIISGLRPPGVPLMLITFTEIIPVVLGSSNRWAEIIEQLIDRLIGKNMSMTYDFNNHAIDVPKAEGPSGEHSVQWTINGKIIITTEVHDKK
jgi:hypothetical protein